MKESVQVDGCMSVRCEGKRQVQVKELEAHIILEHPQLVWLQGVER
jgi:hypothetical protein